MQSKYEVIGIVGEGAFGIVYKCRNKETKEYVAIKKFKETEDEIVKKTMKRELKMLQIIKHENIVEFKDAFKRKTNLFLVFEYVDRNLLEVLQESPTGLDQGLIKKLIFQICVALKYLHEQSIVHRDIKPENLLVDGNSKLKVCDFGFARYIKPSQVGNFYTGTHQNQVLTDYVATRWYRSPELLLTNGVYGPEIDYWAVGCIMGELTDGDPLFPGNNEIDQLNLIVKTLGNLSYEQTELFHKNPHFQGMRLVEVNKAETLEKRYGGKISKVGISFLKGLLELNPNERINDENVLLHPYFEGLNKETIGKNINNNIVSNVNPNGNDNKVLDKLEKQVLSERDKEKEKEKEVSNINININTVMNYNINNIGNSQSNINNQLDNNNYKTFYKKKDDIYNYEVDMNNITTTVNAGKQTNQTNQIKEKQEKTDTSKRKNNFQMKNSSLNNNVNPNINKQRKYENKFKSIQEENQAEYVYNKSVSPSGLVGKYHNVSGNNNIHYKGVGGKGNQQSYVYLPNIKQKIK